MGITEPRRPRVFLSYSRAPETHRLLVRDFWTFLRGHGIDARMDLDGDEQPRNIPAWIGAEFAAADYVLCIASPMYRECFEDDGPRETGRGVQIEGTLITDALVRGGSKARRSFLPVVLPGCIVDDIPVLFAPTTHSFYRITDFSEHGAQNLLRYLRGSSTNAPARVDLAIHSEPDTINTLLPMLRKFPELVAVEHRVGSLTSHIEGADATVAERIGGVLRRIRETADELNVGVHIGLCHHDEPATALELAGSGALRALRTLPGAHVVVAISPGVLELVIGAPTSYPPGSSFRRIEDPPAWVAVLGRRVCPPPPKIDKSCDEPLGEPPRVSVSGTNHGIVAAAGRDVVLGNVEFRAER